jgi:hypothetical protein
MEYDVSAAAVDHLKRQGYHPTPGDLAHLSPLGWEHINLTGDYHWEASSALGPYQFRPLRTRVQSYAAAGTLAYVKSES